MQKIYLKMLAYINWSPFLLLISGMQPYEEKSFAFSENLILITGILLKYQKELSMARILCVIGAQLGYYYFVYALFDY